MNPETLRRLIRFGVASLVVLAPLPFGSVQAPYVLAIELSAAALGLLAILLIGRDDAARAAVPRAALTLCGLVIALGIFQIVPLPFSIAEKFNPTAELVRPLIPYLGLAHPPAVSWSVAAPETTDALLRFIAYVLIGLAAAVAYDDAASRRRFAIVLVAAAVFQAVYGSGEYLSGHQHIFAFAKKHYLDSATGTFINRNHMATLLAMALPFALVLALPEDGRRKRDDASWRERLVAAADGAGLRRLLAVAASAVIWMGLLLSHSRAGLLAALAGAAIVLVRFRGVRAARWAGAIGAVVLLALLTIEIAQAPGERFLTLVHDLDDRAGRPAVWRDAMGLVAARPILGWGFGSFESAFPVVRSAEIELLWDHAHNDWIEWTTEGGVVALGLAIALFAFSLARVWRSSRSSITNTIPVACGAAIVALAVHGVWDFSLRIPAVATISAVIMGLALSRRSLQIEARWSQEFAKQTTPSRIGGSVLLAAAILSCTTAAIAIGVYRTTLGESDRTNASKRLWLGPTGSALEQAAEERLKLALAALDDRNLPDAQRIPTYASELRSTRTLLERAMLADLADTRAVERFAAVSWELGVVDGSPDEVGVSALLDVASRRAPRIPETQIELGETLYKLGRTEDANAFMARAVSLSAPVADRVVTTMVRAGVDPSEILSALPPVPEVAVALIPEFLSRGRGAELLSAIEDHLHADSPVLLAAYGDLALTLHLADRLQTHLSDLRPGNEPHFEAERQLQLARASKFAGKTEAAYQSATAALALWPDDPRYCEFAAESALDSNHIVEAEGILRDGLARLAVTEGTSGWRARLYRGLGQAYEKEGRGDDALVAYRRALEQDPWESVARSKVARIESLLTPKDAPHR